MLLFGFMAVDSFQAVNVFVSTIWENISQKKST